MADEVRTGQAFEYSKPKNWGSASLAGIDLTPVSCLPTEMRSSGLARFLVRPIATPQG